MQTKNFAILTALLLTLAAQLSHPATGWGQEQIRWTDDFQKATETARAENKLVLLHFYSDDCTPCVKVERNVFTQAEVAQAVNRNYVPLRVHVKQSPQLASRYQIRGWPTDVVVNPVGQEVFRTISPPSPQEYVAMVDQIALQAGVGAGRTNQADALSKLGPYATNAAQPAPPAAQAPAQQPTFAGYSPVAAPEAQPVASNYPVQNPYATPAQAPAVTQQLPYQQQPAQPLYTQPLPVQAQLPPANYAPQQPIINRYAANAIAPANTVAQSIPPQYAAQPAIGSSPEQPGAWNQAAVGSQAVVAQYVPASQAPTVAMEGYCPVTILEKTIWKKGDPQFGAVHRRRTYLFASAEEQKRFLADPDRYSPVLSGCDPVRFAANGELADGKRSFGLTYRNQLFLFADEASRDRFEQSPAAFTTAVYQAMMRSETGTVLR